MDFMTELLLIEGCRAQLVREHLRPELEGGSIVLCDRFTDATLAYQGYGRGMDIGLIVKLNEIATEGLCPDLTILLDCPVGVGIERIRGRCSGLSACTAQADERNGREGSVCVPRTGRPDRLESEERGFHERVRSGYLELAGKSGGRIQVVDSTGDVDTVQGSIFAHLLAAMEGSKQACRSRRSSDRIG
jgi:dTMP kinase